MVLLLMSVMFGSTVWADDVIIGTGNVATNSAPYNNSKSYSTTSMLYKASEIGKAGRITSIAFNVANSYSINTTNVTIYFAMVTKSWLNSAQDFISQKNLVQVYSGSPTIGSQSGWEKLELNTVYEYDGTSNLVIIVSNSSSSNSSLKYQCTFFDDDYCLVRGGWDTSYADIYDTSRYFSSSSHRPNIKIGMEPSQYTKESFVKDGVKYETVNSYEVKVVDNSYLGEISIPSYVEHEGKTFGVNNITPGVLKNCTSVSLPMEYDFGNNSTLKKLYIDEGVTSFSGFASCTALEDVSLPGSLTSVEYCFTNCTSLKTVAFRYGTAKLKGLSESDSYSRGTFQNCKLDSIFVDREFDYDFSQCRYSNPFSYNGSAHTLRSVRIGDNLKTVQANMFYNSNELRTIILGNSLTSIENNGFGDCEKVEGDLVMPSTLKTIGNGAFSWGWHNAGEGNLVLNEGLETIGASAFAYCPKLNVENIPSTVTSIGNYAFNDCKFEKLTIPNKVTSIGESAFSSGAEELIIEDGTSTLSLSNSAFGYDTRKLKKLYLGRNITHNQSSGGPFEYCYTSTHTLQNVEIGDRVTSIPANTFYRCSAMESITIGSKVSSIGKDAFDGTGFKEIIIKAVAAPTITAPSYSSGVFSGIPVYVPAGSKSSYQAANYWKNNIIIDPSDELITVNLTMPGTLEGRLRIQKVEPANVNKLKIIGEMNDNDWAYIKKTIMPNMYSVDLSEVTNTNITAQQFQSHTYLVNAVLPNGITTIGDYAFEGSNLSGDFTMPSSLEQIGNYAFKGTKIGDVSLSNDVTIGNYAFNNSRLKSITLNKCINIGQYAFAGCSNLSGSYQLHSQLTAIPDYAFQNCSSLEGVSLPNGLKTIGEGAFQNCKAITSLEFPKTITSFGKTTSSFVGCSGITLIKTHWQKPISTMSSTFANVDKKKCELYVPKNSTDWYLLTTGWDEFINVIEYDDTEAYNDAITLTDGTNITAIPGMYESITYTRNFTNSNWNALYVPMSINVEDYAGELDFAEIYAFCAMKDTNWDGVVDANDENFLYVSPMKTGCTKPNVPYMIRPKEAKTYEISSADNVLYAKAEGKVEFSTSHDNFTVTGLNEPFTVTAGDNNYYVSTSGSLNYRTTGSTTVKPNRWVMHRESKEYGGGTLTESAAKGSYRIVAIGEDIDEATAIEIIKMQNAGKTANSGIYTIDGRKVNGEKSLSAGIYIKNGKKFIVK